jgi:hypothetical protein
VSVKRGGDSRRAEEVEPIDEAEQAELVAELERGTEAHARAWPRRME